MSQPSNHPRPRNDARFMAWVRQQLAEQNEQLRTALDAAPEFASAFENNVRFNPTPTPADDRRFLATTRA